MNARAIFLAVFCAPCVTMSGCVTPPAADTPATPAPTAVPAQAAPTEVLEARHHERAQVFMRERNWADALVQWELLALLKPDSREYRNALAKTRSRIRESGGDLHAPPNRRIDKAISIRPLCCICAY